MMRFGFLVLFISATTASQLRNPAPAPGPAGGPAGAPESPLDGVKGFVDLLPYSPDRMNYQMTKSKCIDFVNHMLERAGHDATWLPKLMPKCLWSKEECATLEADLLSRIPNSALPGGPAGATPASPAPAAALLTKKVTKKSPGGGDAIFGWCDTLYNMAKTRFFTKMKEDRPSPGMDPLPEDTGDVHRDARAMNKWLEKHGMLNGKAEDLSKEDKIIQKMHKVGNALKRVTGWDHFAPERETAKKMAKSVSGYDHAKSQTKKDAKEEKEDKKEDEKEEKEDKKEEDKEK